MSARNPILAGAFPDPSACQVGDTTYIVNSTFTWLPGLPIRASRDLETWELVGHALTEDNCAVLDLELGAESQGIFAPTLRHIQGRFVLVCTTVVGTTERSFVMTAPEAAGPWSEPRFLDGAGGIDPDVFEDEDGQVWWTGTRLAATPLWEQQTEIWTRPVDLDTATFTGEETVIWHGAVEGVVWSEGPHIYRIGDWYYLLTAEGGTAEEHSVSIARAPSVRGPWQGCKRNPIFTHRNLGRTSEVHNVGHADLFQRPDGSWWAVMLGVRLRDNRHLLGRETFLAPVSWEDEWPVIAPGCGRLPAAIDTAPDIAADQRSLAVASDTPAPLASCEMTPGEFAERALKPVGADWVGDEARSFRGVRAADWHAGISIDAHALAEALTGIGIVQDAHNWLRLRLGDGVVLVDVTVTGATTTRILAAPTPGERLWLRLADLSVEVGCGSEDGRGEGIILDAEWLSTEAVGGFTGCLLGVWASNADACTSPLCLIGTELG